MPLFQPLNSKRWMYISLVWNRITSRATIQQHPWQKVERRGNQSARAKTRDFTSATRHRSPSHDIDTFFLAEISSPFLSFLSTNDAHSRRRECARASPASPENIYNPRIILCRDIYFFSFFFFFFFFFLHRLENCKCAAHYQRGNSRLARATRRRTFPPPLSANFFFSPKFQTFEAYATPSIPHKFAPGAERNAGDYHFDLMQISARPRGGWGFFVGFDQTNFTWICSIVKILTLSMIERTLRSVHATRRAKIIRTLCRERNFMHVLFPFKEARSKFPFYVSFFHFFFFPCNKHVTTVTLILKYD